MNYSKQFKLVEQEVPIVGCNGCCFIGDGCNLQVELGGEEFIKDFDSQVGSCVTDGGVYIRVPKLVWIHYPISFEIIL